MKNEAIVIVALCIILLFLSSVYIYEWKIFYKAVNEWDIGYIKGKVLVNKQRMIYCDVLINLKWIAGNVYVVNEKGDTVYRHIKED